mmetsp:Transcript_13074/g.20376  ORF Transcript_13074/g.20376 Transcript_13074/m.20376 type:complete len:103 (+) Transcript_13074:118-426(+)
MRSTRLSFLWVNRFPVGKPDGFTTPRQNECSETPFFKLPLSVATTTKWTPCSTIFGALFLFFSSVILLQRRSEYQQASRKSNLVRQTHHHDKTMTGENENVG